LRDDDDLYKEKYSEKNPLAFMLSFSIFGAVPLTQDNSMKQEKCPCDFPK